MRARPRPPKPPLFSQFPPARMKYKGVYQESGPNTAINRLRLALGDSAENPRYIETVARSGYRFIAPVQDSQWTAAIETLSPPPPTMRKLRRWWVWLIPGVIAAAAVTAYFL